MLRYVCGSGAQQQPAKLCNGLGSLGSSLALSNVCKAKTQADCVNPSIAASCVGYIIRTLDTDSSTVRAVAMNRGFY